MDPSPQNVLLHHPANPFGLGHQERSVSQIPMVPVPVAKSDDDSALLQLFVGAFARLDDSTYTQADPPPDAFFAGIDPEDWNAIRWRPAAWQTPPDAISAIRFAGPLPFLYEMLALSYRWPQVDLGICRLLPNEPARDLQPLASAMLSDPVLSHTLLPAGYVRFALAEDDYDPICFNLNRFADDDCAIVRLEHESILMHDSIGVYNTIFPSFRELVLTVVRSVG